MIDWTEAKARSPLLLTQERAQPSADELVQRNEGAGMGMFEVAEPAAQHRVENENEVLVSLVCPTGAPDGNRCSTTGATGLCARK